MSVFIKEISWSVTRELLKIKWSFIGCFMFFSGCLLLVFLDLATFNLGLLKVRGFCRFCNLTNANLKEINLASADLCYANLNGVAPNEAILTEPDLAGVNLRGTNFRTADLAGAYLSQANLGKANLTDIQIDTKAISTNETFIELMRDEETKRLANEKRKEQERLAEGKEKQ